MDVTASGPLPNELLKRFKVLKRLGVGGASSVFLVEDALNVGIPMAFKLLDPRIVDADNLERFKKEFEVLRALQHPNLIEAYELIETDAGVGYLMEFVKGRNLLELMRHQQPNHKEIESIFSQILSALHELHKNGLAHRDIKLENVLIRDDGYVKLSDLGLMKKVGGARNTETGVLLGTSQYLPPEYVKHSVYDERSDLYALGLMLYECLAGKRWLEGKSGTDAIRYLCEINFEFPKLALSGLPVKYQKILENVLSVQPWKRFESADAMRVAILSDTGTTHETRVVKLEENVRIDDMMERRRTREFQSLKSRRTKMMVGIGGFGAAVAVTLAIGMAKLNNNDMPQEPVQQIAAKPAVEAEVARPVELKTEKSKPAARK